MTNDKMFDEIGCPDKLKECQSEIKRHKMFIQKQANIIKSLELELEQKNNEIIIIKNRWKGKDDWDIFTSTKGTTSIGFIFCGLCYLELY